jgi:hypothetical protein
VNSVSKGESVMKNNERREIQIMQENSMWKEGQKNGGIRK